MLSVAGGGMVLTGAVEVDALADEEGSDDDVGTDDGDDDVVARLGDALVVAGAVDGGGVGGAAVRRAGGGAPVSVLVDVLGEPVEAASGRTFR